MGILCRMRKSQIELLSMEIKQAKWIFNTFHGNTVQNTLFICETTKVTYFQFCTFCIRLYSFQRSVCPQTSCAWEFITSLRRQPIWYWRPNFFNNSDLFFFQFELKEANIRTFGCKIHCTLIIKSITNSRFSARYKYKSKYLWFRGL